LPMPDGPSGENTRTNKTGYRAFLTTNLSYKSHRKINHLSKFFPPFQKSDAPINTEELLVLDCALSYHRDATSVGEPKAKPQG